MKYADLVRDLSVQTGVTQEDIKSVLGGLRDYVELNILKEKEISIPRLVKFSAVDVEEKSGISFKGSKQELSWVKPAHTTLKAKVLTIKELVEIQSNPALDKEKESK